jgi:TDG/mug DNA glycosylase family protein
VPPSPADLKAAKNRTIPDVLPSPGEQLLVLFCGINPSLYSAATGWHFARPGNRFWPALHLSGFTPRQLAPSEQHLLPGYGLGITNLVARATAQAAELTPAELKTGGERLQALVAAHRPRILAIAGVTAYRTAFARPRAATGPQPDPLDANPDLLAANPDPPGATPDPLAATPDPPGVTPVWVLPNPSGLNASWTLPRITAAFRELREATAE